MMQRPGCYVYVVLAAFVGLYLFISWVNDVREAPAEASPLSTAGLQSSVGTTVRPIPTASATMILTATPNPLVLTEASSNATHSAAITALANDQATHDTGTRIASTQTPAYWTADANAIAKQQAEATRNKTLLEAQLLAGTITAAPTSQWKTEVAYFPTMKAEQTQAAFDQQTADNARWWGHVAADAWSLVLVAIPVSIILALIVSAIVMPNAFSWRVQGVTGGQAQASVLAAANAIPGKKDGKPRELIRDAERAALIEFVDLCIKMGGRNLTVIPSQSTFAANGFVNKKWRDDMIGALVDLDLVNKPEQGRNGGTDIADERTLADLADVLRKGSEG